MNNYPILPPYGNNGFRVCFFPSLIPESSIESLEKMGSYSISPVAGLKIISLNSILWAIRNPAYSKSSDPCGQLKWLGTQLQQAKDNSERFHIFHVNLIPEYLS